MAQRGDTVILAYLRLIDAKVDRLAAEIAEVKQQGHVPAAPTRGFTEPMARTFDRIVEAVRWRWRSRPARPVAEVSPPSVQWLRLEGHFRRHAELITRFRSAKPAAVIRMWDSQTNERGEPLSAFERQALVERHCELFGEWPEGTHV